MRELNSTDIDDILSDITGKPGPDISPDIVSESAPAEGHKWALDCYWAYDNMGNRITKAKAGSAARFALWSMANKDPGTFVTDIMPKAMNLLEKARNKNADSESVVRKEEKRISELQEILRAAVEESSYA